MGGQDFHKSVLIFLCSLLICQVCLAQPWQTFPISAKAEKEINPSVHGNYVVWQRKNQSEGDYDIWAANISNPKSAQVFSVSSNDSETLYPKTDSGMAVWQEKARGQSDWDVYAADLWFPNNGAFSVASSLGNELYPDISDMNVVYQFREGFAAYDIVLTDVWNESPLGPLNLTDSPDDTETTPVISHNLAIWRFGDIAFQEAYCDGADFSDPNRLRSFYTSIILGPSTKPVLDGPWLVARDLDGMIQADNLFDPFEPLLLTDPDAKQVGYPAIDKHIVVWDEIRDGNRDIYGYNLTTEQAFRITDHPAAQSNPVVYGDVEKGYVVVVWQDYRNQKYDIYGAILTGPEVAGCVPPLPEDLNNDCPVVFGNVTPMADN
jgi:beta propeller repeat protein